MSIRAVVDTQSRLARYAEFERMKRIIREAHEKCAPGVIGVFLSKKS